jgi:hypothetical protein
MASDTQRMRGDRPWTFTNLKQGDGLSTIIAFLEDKGMLGCCTIRAQTRPDGATLLSLSSCLHLPATPALQYGIRFANSSHA